MKYLPVFALFVLLIAGCNSITGSEADEGATVSGTVVSSDAEPVENANVLIRMSETFGFSKDIEEPRATTDENGSFHFDGLRGGKYAVSASNQDSTVAGVATMTVYAGTEVDDVVITLE